MRQPEWTVLGQRLEGDYMAHCVYYYADRATAQARFDELVRAGWVPTLWPWHRGWDLKNMSVFERSCLDSGNTASE